MLAGPDGQELHQAAFHVPAEVRVRLDAIDREDGAGPGRVAVEIDGQSVRGPADGDDVHGGADGAADRGLADAEGLEHGPLPFGGRAAMTAHRRKDEWLAAQRLDLMDKGLDDQRDAVDPAAAHGDGDRRARPDAPAEIQRGELAMHAGGHRVVRQGAE